MIINVKFQYVDEEATVPDIVDLFETALAPLGIDLEITECDEHVVISLTKNEE